MGSNGYVCTMTQIPENLNHPRIVLRSKRLNLVTVMSPASAAGMLRTVYWKVCAS